MILHLPSVATVSHIPNKSNVSELETRSKINIGHTSFLSVDNAPQYAAKSVVVPLGFTAHQSQAQIFLKESAKETHLHGEHLPCGEYIGRLRLRWLLGGCTCRLGPPHTLSWHAGVSVSSTNGCRSLCSIGCDCQGIGVTCCRVCC